MNHKKIIIGLVIAVVVAVIILLFVKAAKDKKDKETADKLKAAAATAPTANTGTPAPNIAPPSPAATTDKNFPIVYNKFSERAKDLQKQLGFTGSAVDGIIGEKTLKKWNDTLASSGINNLFTIYFKIENAAQLNTAIKQISTAQAATAFLSDTTKNWANPNGYDNIPILMF